MERDELVYIKNILKASNTKKIDFSLLENVFTVFEHEPERKDDLFDSFSRNQFVAKNAIINHLDDLNLLNLSTEIVIWGSWYGSILVALLHDRVKKITCIDSDESVITIGDNRLFPTYDNVEWIAGDIFKEYRDVYDTADIFINTSCEHMDNNWFESADSNQLIIMQSNDSPDFDGHINTCNDIEHFKAKYPMSRIHFVGELKTPAYTRYMQIGYK